MIRKIRKIIKRIPFMIPIYIYIYNLIHANNYVTYNDEFASSVYINKKILSHQIKSILDKREYANYYIASDIDFTIPGLNVFSWDINVKKENSLVIVYYTVDDLVLPILEHIIENNIKFIPIGGSDKKSNRFSRHAVLDTLMKTLQKKDRLSHLRNIIHENICQALEYTKDLEGDYVEIGVYKGGSAYTAMMYCQLNSINRKFYLFDTFDGFNYEESSESSDILWKGTHKLFGVNETIEYLNKTFSEFEGNYSLIPSNIINDQLPEEIKKISLANIDVDLYEATYTALEKVSKLMVKGGIIICEDPKSTPMLYGAYYAMEKFLSSDHGLDFKKIDMIGQYFLIKQ